jgi:hypothetical protein
MHLLSGPCERDLVSLGLIKDWAWESQIYRILGHISLFEDLENPLIKNFESEPGNQKIVHDIFALVI